MDYNSSVQNLAWFHDRYREGTLSISPPFQRKPVWAARQKCFLIESILLGLPVPEIFIQQKTTADGKTDFTIVDGQQRIRSVLQFIGSETDEGELQYNKFILDKLAPESPWRDRSFADLSDDERRSFFGYRFVVRYLNTDIDEEIRGMFRRLNQFLTPLKPQELRNAIYAGPFVRLVVDLANDEYWAENKIITSASIRRMGDVEFVSELLIGAIHGPQGGSSATIDDYYRQYEDYDDEFPSQRKSVKLFRETLDTVRSVLPEIKDSRWGNKTDFYSLFVAIAQAKKTGKDLPASKRSHLREALKRFANNVDQRLADDMVAVDRVVIDYVSAVEKGVNDKPRRAVRHAIVLGLIDSFFRVRGFSK